VIKNINLSDFAVKDLEIIYSWYEDKHIGLGEEFILEIDETLLTISRYPAAGVECYEGIRKILIPRFPFLIYYHESKLEIKIMAVTHAHRDPDYVEKQLKDRVKGDQNV